MTRREDPFLDEFLRELMQAGIDVEQLSEFATTLPQRAPEAGTRHRLMSSLEHGGRLHRFAGQIAELLDVDTTRARQWLDAIDDPSSWQGGPGPGVTLFHIDGGPAVASAINGFVCVERGQCFPHHSHLGDEAVMIVQGRFKDSHSGNVYGPGDVVREVKGSAHRLDVLPGPKLIYLAIVFGGVNIGGTILRPGDPRI